MTEIQVGIPASVDVTEEEIEKRVREALGVKPEDVLVQGCPQWHTSQSGSGYDVIVILE